MKDVDLLNLKHEFVRHNYAFDGVLNRLSNQIKAEITEITLPKQGADSIVFFIKTGSDLQFAVKIGLDVNYDISALKLLSTHNIDFIPQVYSTFHLGKLFILITEKIEGPLYHDIPQSEKSFYFESIIKRAKEIQVIKNQHAGLIEDCLKGKGQDWKQYLQSKYNGEHRYFDWEEIFKRNGVDRIVVERTIQDVQRRISNIRSLLNNSMLHTDLNQRNMFVDRTSKKIISIIDWTESIFGDPLYEFARVRMNIRFNQPENESLFLGLLQLSEAELSTEQLYFDIHMLDYVNWYSESGDSRLNYIINYLAQITNGSKKQ